MQVTETLTDGLKRELKVVIPAKELDSRLMNRLTDLKDRVQIKGFRPGKVPVAHLKRVYGRNVMAEVVQETVSETSQKAIEARNEKPAFQPQVAFTEDANEIEQVMAGEADLAYSLTFEIMPEIALADFSKIELTREVADVPEDEVQSALERIAGENRPYAPREAGEKAQSGDRATIDYKGFVDGEAFEGGADDNAFLVLGSNRFIPGFEEQLIGAAAGDAVTVKVTFPEDYPATHLAGKEAEFAVTVKEVAAPGDTKIDDEFAQQLGIESLDKLKAAIREQMSGELTQASRRKIKRALLDALDETHSFELPPTLVEQEFNAIWNQLTRDMEQSGRTFADEETTEDEARADYRKIAERRVRLGLVLAEVGDSNKIQVTDDEVNRALAEQIRQFPGQEQAVWDYYQKNPQALAQLRAPIFEDKVVDFILELAKITDKTVSREELFHDHDHDHGHDHGHDEKKPAKKAAAKKPAAKKAAPKKAAKDD